MRPSYKGRGIVIMNLGSPDSTNVPDIKRYLDEFLMDKRVMDYPYLLRLLLVKGIITPRRAPKSAEAYKKIWWPEGSPLIVITERIRIALEQQSGMPVETAMRYGAPHPREAFRKLQQRVPGLEEVVLLPLYPHYAMASYETALQYVMDTYRKGAYTFKLSPIRPFYREPAYIERLAENIKGYLTEETDYLLFSFHGVPVRHIRKGDITGRHCLQSTDCCSTDSSAHAFCYRHQVMTTARLTAEALGLNENQYGISFQSRLGKEEWLRPYTSEVLAELPKKGMKNLVVASPAFTADCLETLEEIALEGKEIFLEAGGKTYKMTPGLNDSPAWIALLHDWIRQTIEGDETMLLKEEALSNG